jgi:hypothetical protein
MRRASPAELLLELWMHGTALYCTYDRDERDMKGMMAVVILIVER